MALRFLSRLVTRRLYIATNSGFYPISSIYSKTAEDDEPVRFTIVI